jgi:hypothetical protein
MKRMTKEEEINNSLLWTIGNLNPIPIEYEEYCKTLTKYERKIFQVIVFFIKNRYIKLSRRTIHKKVGCSITTVTRAFRRFERDNMVLRHRNHPFSSNVLLVNHPQAFKMIHLKVENK